MPRPSHHQSTAKSAAGTGSSREGKRLGVPVFKAGDRVHHTGRKESGTVLDSPSDVVRVLFDNPTPRGNQSIGEFDEVWFNTHPNWLNRESR